METHPDVEAQTQGVASSSSRKPRRCPTSVFIAEQSVDEEKKHDATKYGDTSATYWKLYMSEAEISDKKFVESLKGDTKSMVFLNSLFSAIVGSFIIEIYKTLLPDNSQRTVDLLSQLVSQSSSTQSPSPLIPNIQSFTPPWVAVRINIILFLSFFLSMMSAVGCSLIQQWCLEYMKYAYPRAAPYESGRVRTYLFQGLDQFQMRRFMYGTHVLLHISVFLFFLALSDFFCTVHPLFGDVTRYCLVAASVVYMALSISPLIFGNSPYNTPLTPPLRACGVLLIYTFRIILRHLRRDYSHPSKLAPQFFKGVRFDRAQFLIFKSEVRAAKLEPYAMEWLFTENDFSDSDMDRYLEGLPGYLSSHHTKGDRLDTYLINDYILKRIKDHFVTCATSPELSDDASISRVFRCVRSLRLVFKHCIPRLRVDQVPSGWDKEKVHLQRRFNQELVDDFETLCDHNMDPIVALRASCIRGLAVQDLLTQITHSDEETPFDRSFSMVIIPFYTFFFKGDNKDVIQRLHNYGTLNRDENEALWKDFLYDGPLVNLTILAEAVRSAESAPSSSLSFCWKVLDLLLSQLRIARTEVSQSTLDRFNAVHKKTRNHVRGTEKGFRIARLLEILDAVSRGLRLSMAFSDHPQYHSRADLVFGEEHLWNRDLLEAFAHCLPDYIAKISHDEGREFMEGMVCNDDLWTSLQVNLWNARRSDSPTPDQFRVFEDCCTVLDVAFSALEDSSKVDWRAPEFGSLTQHFELFITHCFQGTFMSRATSFRVGMIKARFCKALLSQFRYDVDREAALFFRSQWDLASLARLFCTLGIGDGEYAEFWKSYINGGHIKPGFIPKARGTVDVAFCDGPLLIICKLAQLVISAVPLKGSSLGMKDIERVWELQENIVKNKRLPLTRASIEVWEELDQLRNQVNNLCGKNTGDDGDTLQRLLGRIDRVRDARTSHSNEQNPGKYAEVQGSMPSAAVKPTLSLRGLRDSRSSFASESTAITGGRFCTTPTSEEDFEDIVPDLERNTHARSSSPQNQNDNAAGHDIGSPDLAIMNGTIGNFPFRIPLANPYLPCIGDTEECTPPPALPPTRRNSSRMSASRPGLVTLAGTSLLSRARRHRPTSPPNPASSSSSTSFDFSDPRKSGIAPNVEAGKDE